MRFKSTGEAAAALDRQHYHLDFLIRTRRIPAPQRSPGGDFLWTDEDIERARQALATVAPRRGHQGAAHAAS
jgi:hypothetical protein